MAAKNEANPALTVEGPPITATANFPSTTCRSASFHNPSIDSTGGSINNASPRINFKNRCFGEVANRSAAASVSAAITGTPAITYGASKYREARNCARYNPIASISKSGAKWLANANGKPNFAANCALNVLDPNK